MGHIGIDVHKEESQICLLLALMYAISPRKLSRALRRGPALPPRPPRGVRRDLWAIGSRSLDPWGDPQEGRSRKRADCHVTL